ncbi:MAG: SMC-Scp complex subunit ScpB [Clostridia bacterium]|nr:SMC-Scp complex subunit ScpB [Clostridia bacterium]MBR4973153.1 SMC-Scp complex subunit ScpB [Clostridia bacterium]
MKATEFVPAFEALLYASGEPLSIERIAQVFDIEVETVNDVMNVLRDKMIKNGSGLELVRMENTYQLATKTEYAEYIKKAFDLRRRTPLSSAALEVLAVVAYNQPVTKSFIEQVRGVDCSGVVTTLVEKGLIEEQGRLELPGKPLLYGTTKNFLRCFSLNDLSELPPLPQNENDERDIGEQLKIENTNEEATEV